MRGPRRVSGQDRSRKHQSFRHHRPSTPPSQASPRTPGSLVRDPDFPVVSYDRPDSHPRPPLSVLDPEYRHGTGLSPWGWSVGVLSQEPVSRYI